MTDCAKKLPATSRLAQKPICRRALLLFCFFAFWSIAVVWRLAHFMILDRDHYMAQIERESVTEGIVPAPRGAILDRDGNPLAWSRRHFALLWQVPAKPRQALGAWAETQLKIKTIIAANADSQLQSSSPTLCETLMIDPGDELILSQLGSEIVLCTDLPPAILPAFQQAFQDLPGLQLRSYFRRHYRREAQDRLNLGQIKIVNGTETGVSGLEKSHDSVLRGQPGIYRIMRDRRGKWMPETWQSVRKMRPGYDIYLPLQIPIADTRS